LAVNIRTLLDKKVAQYNNPEFIENDPVSIPHMFTGKEDIEISGFLTAILSWGRRTAIIKSAKQLMMLMDNSPYNFLTKSSEQEFKRFGSFVYRTFNSDDCLFLITALRNIYLHNDGLETIVNKAFNNNNSVLDVIVDLRNAILQTHHLVRSEKHLANPQTGSAAKRINMYLRWMVREDNHGVDFGIWKEIPQSHLMCPLDVHSGNVARKLGLLIRKQNDWKAVEELTRQLRTFDSNDPVKYDFALFGMGVFEGLS
jgi:uncharacterized protein (TIGR02757 family)|tara:strand:- start:66 stop:833 length:768 start_codon:yes stop_codon:yes gene_type:complete